MSIFAWILTLSIVAGQLVRVPLGPGAITLLDLMVLTFVIFYLLKFRFKFQKTPSYIKSAFLFIAVASLSLLLTPLQLTFQDRAVSFSYTLRFMLIILSGWIIAQGALKKQIFEVLKLAGVALAILGILQVVLLPDLVFLETLGWDPHFFRVASTFLDPNFTGAFLVLTLMLVRKNYAMFTMVYLALLLTFSRSSYGMFFISFSALAFLLRSLRLQLLTLALFAGLLLGFFLYSRFIELPRGINRSASASFRINTWKQGWQLVEKHPVLGVGFNAYRYAIREFKLADMQFLQSHGSSSNDSSLLFVLATTGALGLLSYILFLFWLIKSRKMILLPAVSGLLFHSLFANSLFFPSILLWLILAVTVDKADSTS
ncbi:O-antigen ligase family protein [Candidatus Daviesbacteria bacterium]|nr:O-antigen ligase family protein [Candidatus Daviesbacteria bacterium]